MTSWNRRINLLVYSLTFFGGVSCLVHDIDSLGAKRDDSSAQAAKANADALNAALAAAKPGDTVLVQGGMQPYYFTGGVVGRGLVDVNINFAANIILSDDMSIWPKDGKSFLNFFSLCDSTRILINGGGSVDGKGQKWWDTFINREEPVKSFGRVHMMTFDNVTDLIVERLTLRNSPNFHMFWKVSSRVTVRYIRIEVDRLTQRRLKSKALSQRLTHLGVGEVADVLAEYIVNREIGSGKSWKDWFLDEAVKMLPHWALQPEDLNTDGIDPSGTEFHIHDCEIENDDDSIAVKGTDRRSLSSYGMDCSRNMLIENMVLTGFGASIGSVTPHADVTCVRNITFRNISMPGTGKGIYIKSNPSCSLGSTGIIEGITYEDIHMSKPFWWSIWIGPQQQHEPDAALGEKCSLDYPISGYCPTQGCVTFANITLRRVRIDEPFLSAGVILGNATNPMQNIIFDDVVVKPSQDPFYSKAPYGLGYKCEYAMITSTGGTSPVPKCTNSGDTLNVLVL